MVVFNLYLNNDREMHFKVEGNALKPSEICSELRIKNICRRSFKQLSKWMALDSCIFFL